MPCIRQSLKNESEPYQNATRRTITATPHCQPPVFPAWNRCTEGANPLFSSGRLQIPKSCVKCAAHLAQVAELVDALVSGTSG
ncbi:hypothetical protein A3768_4075 (plasmid) [Ralstonia solanacearum]|nr:hypothetical protein A3768_4075 [Ralstonia solanacearum]